MDLCSLMESKIDNNIRLKTVAGEIFRRYYYKPWKFSTVEPYDKTLRLLSNFGPSLSHISYTQPRDNDPRIIESIIQNCSETLESLFAYRCTFDAYETKIMFPSLQKLELYDFHYNASNVFAHCTSLVELVLLSWNSSVEHLFLHTYPELEHFRGGRNSETFKNFITRHRKLKSIKLEWHCDPVLVLPVIADHCSHLKKLEMRFKDDNNFVEYETAVRSISRLIHLEDVTINFSRNGWSMVDTFVMEQLRQLPLLKKFCLTCDSLNPNTIPKLLQLRTLEELDISVFYAYIDFTPLVELSGLKKLTLAGKTCYTDIVHMVSRLPDLEELNVYQKRVKIDKRMVAKIVDVLSRCARPTLQIKCGERCFRFTLTNKGVAVQDW